MKKRILSMLMVLCMVFTLLPSTAFATEGNIPLGTSSVTGSGKAVCENHKEHDDDCGYIEAVEGEACSHLNEDGTYSCAPVRDSGVASPSIPEKAYACDHDDACGYTKAVKEKPCTHVCELCKPAEKPMLLTGTRSADITGIGYTFDTTNGALTVTTNDGTTAWQQDTSIVGSLDTPDYTKVKSVSIGSGVTSIGNYAFGSCTALATVTFEGTSKLKTIGNYAFQFCRGLTSITIPAGVTSIGNSTFEQCTVLATVTFEGESQLETIGNYAFQVCTVLATVTFEGTSKLKTIGNYAFQFCSGLTSITIPENVATIGDKAFYSCSNLAEVICKPASVPSLGTDVFTNTASSLKIKVPDANVDAYKQATNWSALATKIVGETPDTPNGTKITTALDFTSSAPADCTAVNGGGHIHSNSADYCFTWANGTLTLNNLNLETSADTAIKLPAGATVNMGGTSTVTSTFSGNTTNYTNGILGMGNLAFTGTGILTATGGTSTNSYSLGVYTSANSLTVSGTCTLKAIGGTGFVGSHGVDAKNVEVLGGTLNATGGEGPESNGVAVYANSEGTINVSGGTLETKTTSTAPGGNVQAVNKAPTAGSGATLAVTGSKTVGGSLTEVTDLATNFDAYKHLKVVATPAAAITTTAIPGVTAPVTGATPVTTITTTTQYTGTVAWSDSPTTFAPDTAYTATITLTPKSGFTLTGVGANFFTVAGASSVTNSANSGVITAVFPKTAVGTAATPTFSTNLTTTEQVVNTSASTTLTVAATASDGGTITYQWYSNTANNTSGTAISGATGASYTFTSSATPNNTTYYYCVATNTKDGATATATSAVKPVRTKNNVATMASFSFASPSATGTVSDGTVAISVPNGTAVTSLAPTITLTDSNAIVSPTSGTAQNFTSPVTYTVTAEDGTTKTYAVTVTVLPAPDAAIDIAAIPGVTAPVKGATPVTTITETAQYTGTVAWSGTMDGSGKFAPDTAYTATITLTPKTGFTLTGVSENFFTVAGADSVTNSVNSGVVTAVFPKTAAPTYGVSLDKTGTHTFAAQTAGYGAQTPLTVTVSNTGNQASGALTVALSGTNSGSFTLNKASISDIAAGDSDSFTVVPNTGLTAGTYTATVTVSGGNGITSQSFNVSFTVNNKVNAVTPIITNNLSTAEVSYTVGAAATALDATATVTDGGTVSYQWYSNDTNDTTTPTQVGTGATYTPPTASAGTTYYYCVVKNTITDNGDGGSKTASVTSNIAKITVNAVAPTAVAFNGLTANGASGTTTTTELTLTFDKGIAGLAVGDLTVTGADKGTLTKQSGTGIYKLTISGITVANGGTVNVAVAKTGFTFNPANKDVTVFKDTSAPTTYTITANAGTGGSISPNGSVSVNNGANQTFTISPSSNYSISSVIVDGVNQGAISSYTFNNVTAAHTISATFSYNGGGGGSTGGGGSSSGGGSSITVTPPAQDKPNTPTQGEIKLDGKVEGEGATISITDKNITDAFDKALADAKKKGNESNGITLVLSVDTGSKTVNTVTVNLPKTAQETIISKKIVNTIVVVDQPDIVIGMDLATVTEINKQANADVNITATSVGSGALTGNAKTAVGNRPVFDLKVSTTSGKTVQSFGAGSVSVTIPYTLAANEKAGNVQAVYLDGTGKVQWLTSSVYDSVNKLLRFSTNHFSTYGVGYKADAPALTDIAAHWAKDDIQFVVNRGLLAGTSATTFSPDTAMTRGMFVTALGRLANADVSGYKQSSFPDVAANSYYMGYIEWASKNGIVSGGTDGKFSPDASITREQMAVIMSNYAKTIGFTTPKVHAENTFADSAKISAYAKGAVKQMQMAGVLAGKSGNNFDPQGTATRAEVSAVLRRFVELVISSDTMQGWTMNDSGQWMYYQDGKPVTGKKDIDGASYTFDQNGVTADVPKNLKYTTYTVQKGDSFWLIAHKLGCSMSELERLNNKTRFEMIHPGDVLIVPEK